MTTKKRSHGKAVSVIFVLLLCAITMLSGRVELSAFAESEIPYSYVMDDLNKADNFDASKYPQNSTDNSLRVIQLAESTGGELFVYTYQPNEARNGSIATDVSMSLSDSADDTLLYALTLLNSAGVFFKYKLTNYTVADDTTRYYNITSIYRKWDKLLDAPASDGNSVNKVAFNVGQLWKVTTAADGVEYEMTAAETVTVTDQMIGFRRYSDGFMWANTKSCDAHYLLFSCDHDIDKLISADISFRATPYKARGGKVDYTITKGLTTVTLRYDDVVSNDGSGWFGKKEKWQRMASTAEFADAVELTDDEKAVFGKYDWVLNFYETDYTCEAGGKDVLITCLVPFGFVWTIVNSCTTTGTIVSEVTMLRLEFDCNGEIYNLGVVDNVQTGSDKPTSGDKTGFDLWAWLEEKTGLPQWAWKLIAALIPIVILVPVLAFVCPIVGQGVLIVLKGLWWLICLPFKGIAALVRKIKDKKDGGE